MRDSLQRLYETKLAFLATVFTVLGACLLAVTQLEARLPGLAWLSYLPVTDIGSALFTTGLVVVVFEYLDGRDSEERATIRLRRVLEEQAPAMRDAVIEGFALNPADLRRVATPELLDQLIRNSLALRLSDDVFAGEIYDDLRDQVIRSEERWHDARVSVRLTPLSMDRAATEGGSSAAAADRLFVVSVRWEYSVVPAHGTRRFSCLGDRSEYAELARDPGDTSAWYFKPSGGFTAADREAFELVEFTVDGEPRAIRRAVRKDGQTYTVSLGHDAVQAGVPVAISYTYRTITERTGNLLYLEVEQPTKGIDLELDYGSTDIASISVLDFIPSSLKTRVARTPAGVPGRSVSLAFDGWVLPRSGVAFVWSLDEHLSGTRPAGSTSSPQTTAPR